jgi:hypothetical protein
MQQGDIAAEMERARVDFHHLLDNGTSTELRAGTDGTKWTNEQLLFYMLFGNLLVHNLLVLVKAFTRLPRSVSKAFAATLDAATRPFHVVNYLGSLGGARVLGHARMERLMDFGIGRLQRSVIGASDQLIQLSQASGLIRAEPRMSYPLASVARQKDDGGSERSAPFIRLTAEPCMGLGLTSGRAAACRYLPRREQ